MQKKPFALLLGTLLATGFCLDASAGGVQLGAATHLDAQASLPVQGAVSDAHHVVGGVRHHTRTVVRTGYHIARVAGRRSAVAARAGVHAGGRVARHPHDTRHISAPSAGVQASGSAQVQASGYGASRPGENDAGAVGSQAQTSAQLQAGARVDARAPVQAALRTAGTVTNTAGTVVNGVTGAVGAGVSGSAGVHLGGLLQ